ncbi:hypothetical protein ADICEAN_04257 [Cesiribacter andamanensis AMV16]|uniref:Uncharacterized protein n=1 Tax=Cesiribacter andamanensis AMV16 TaxID=1279009 RepID=M7NFL8_9BACT|nr:hypothetical protein ADICEAN_04257 [Cesiribacter andamanensis AMV16]
MQLLFPVQELVVGGNMPQQDGPFGRAQQPLAALAACSFPEKGQQGGQEVQLIR